MAVDGINNLIQNASLKELVSQNKIEAQQQVNEQDVDEAARKKLVKKLAIKKTRIKGQNAQRETFQRTNTNDQKIQQIMGGSAGPEAAEGARAWQQNGDLQQKLTSAQKEMFREGLVKNPKKTGQAGKALDNLAKTPGFGKAVNNSQQMGSLQKAMMENPANQKMAAQILSKPAMQSNKTDGQVKKRFMEFGLKQNSKGQLNSVKKAGDLLGALNKGGIGRNGQRATMGMLERNPASSKSADNVDAFVKNPNVAKLPVGARSKGTELLAKANGKGDVKEGLENLAGDKKLQTQTAQNKGRFFATVGTGRPSEYRQISDSLLTSLQSENFPKRAGQVQKFLGKVSAQVQQKGAAGVNTQAAMKAAKSSPMPKLSLVPIGDDADPEQQARARSQNRANVMAYAQKLNRMYEKTENGLKSAKYLEDVNKLKNNRPPEDVDLSSLAPEERELAEGLINKAKDRYASIQTLQKKMARMLRSKRRRNGKAGLRRTRSTQPKYFSPNATRGQKTSEAFLQATGTTGAPQGLAQTPQRGIQQQRMMQQGQNTGAGDIQAQVQAALAGLSGPITAESAGQVAQVIAQQVATQVASQVFAQLQTQSGLEVAQAPQAARKVAAPQKTAVDGWGIPRRLDRDLGGIQNTVVKAPVEDDTPSFDEAVNEAYTGKMLIKDQTSIRELGELFSANWKTLNRPEMALLKNLGWNQQMWDTKNTPAAKWPGAMMSGFVNLTPVQREAVRKLGFTPHDWDTKVQAFTSGKNT